MSKVVMKFNDHWHLIDAIREAKQLIEEAEKRSRSEIIKHKLTTANQWLESALNRKYEVD